MFVCSPSRLAIAVLAFLGCAEAWKLDKSCEAEGVVNNITPLIERAIAMANTARADLEAYSNPNVVNAARWMLVKDNPRPETERREVGHAIDTFKRIVELQGTQVDMRQPNTALSGDDFVVYCNLDRFERKIVKGIPRLVDTENKFSVRGPSIQFWEACRLADVTAAYVPDPDPDNPVFPSQIQICPWFLEWIKNPDQAVAKHPNRKVRLIASRLVNYFQEHGKLAPIDSENALQKVFLHEITHTRGARFSQDFDISGGIHGKAYGWPTCRKLARESNPLKMGSRNADSLALLANAISVTHYDPPHRVTESGDIVENPVPAIPGYSKTVTGNNINPRG